MARYLIYLLALVSFSLERMCNCNPMTTTFNDENKIFRSSCRRDALFKITDRNKKLVGQAISLVGSSRVKSLLMCVKLCIQAATCRSVNYKSESTSSTERNCQLLDVAKSNSTAQLTDAAGWKHYEPVSQNSPRCRLAKCGEGYSCVETCQTLQGFQCIDINECASNPCQNGGVCRDGVNKYTCACAAGYTGKRCEAMYYSCKEIKNDNPHFLNGVYQLRSGRHYCVMDNLPGCGVGGWTLALKIDGSKDTFRKPSSYWESDITYNVQNGLKSFENEEAKFPAFRMVGFTSICLGMKKNDVTKWISISKSETSLFRIFKGANYQPTFLGRTKWISLFDGADLQGNCNHEGFNVKDANNQLIVRIGILGNKENDCSNPVTDSAFGFGSFWRSVGDITGVYPMGYILVK